MSDDTIRLGWLQRTARALLYAASIGGVVLIVFGVYLTAAWSMTGAGIGLIAGGATMILVFGLAFAVVVAMVHIHAETHRTRRALLNLLKLQRESHESRRLQLSTIVRNVELSDAAKSLTHRDKERDALRTTIREDITREDWDAAYSLIDQMANRFGYREEAQRFREEVDQSRRDAVESKVNMAIQLVDELLASCDWERARAEVRRLISLFPDHERIAALPERLERSFQERKKLLRTQFQEAAERKEVNRSIELVKELDAYLPAEEAKELTETVREVFRDKLDNLTVQFELAVHEQKWLEAVDVARQIMTEYPNTRRAQELRDGAFESLARRAGLAREQVQASPSEPGQDGT